MKKKYKNRYNKVFTERNLLLGKTKEQRKKELMQKNAYWGKT